MIPNSKLFRSIAEKVEGTMGVWKTDGMSLAYLASQVPANGVIVELGAARGRSAAYMAAAIKKYKNIRIFCVDLWNKHVEGHNPAHMSSDEDFIAFKKYLRDLGLMEYITPIRGDSAEIAEGWNKPIDLLFIDSDHSYDGVKAAYESWYPHVKKGGLIAFHDYHPNKWGVKKFIDEIASKELKFVGINGYERIVWAGEK